MGGLGEQGESESKNRTNTTFEQASYFWRQRGSFPVLRNTAYLLSTYLTSSADPSNMHKTGATTYNVTTRPMLLGYVPPRQTCSCWTTVRGSNVSRTAGHDLREEFISGYLAYAYVGCASRPPRQKLLGIGTIIHVPANSPEKL